MRLLIDECLSPNLVTIAQKLGHEAYHVARIGKAGWRDWNVAQHAQEHDFVLVTNNGSDFLKIYGAAALHAGLVILIPSSNREVQAQLFVGALDDLAEEGELINQVLEVDLDGAELRVRRYDLPT